MGGWSDVYLTMLPCKCSTATSNPVQSDSMVVIEVAKEKEPGATGSASASDQGTEKPHSCSGVAMPIYLQYNVRMWLSMHLLCLTYISTVCGACGEKLTQEGVAAKEKVHTHTPQTSLC